MKRARGSALAERQFEKNVFVNCPFDTGYYALLRPMLFSIVSLGFTPRIATERSDSVESRIDKICQLIKESRYSIHDLSRLKPGAKQFARMNMPFELGLDYGSRRFGTGPMRTKLSLILGAEKYDYQKALSDLSGIDIKSHSDEPERIVRAVRDWFFETAGVRPAPSPTALWYDFTDFMTALYDARRHEAFDDAELDLMPVPEFVDVIQQWVVAGTPVASSRRRAAKSQSARYRRA